MTYKLFNDITHAPLRAYNRAVTLSNILEDEGSEAAMAYADCFTLGEKKQIYIILIGIDNYGVEAIKKKVIEGVEFSYDPGGENKV